MTYICDIGAGHTIGVKQDIVKKDGRIEGGHDMSI